jgi:hypothetical protein
MARDAPPDWDMIVEAHAERVYRIAFRILGSVQDAEDHVVMMETASTVALPHVPVCGEISVRRLTKWSLG